MIIDVHGHIVPPDFVKRFPIPPSLGDVEGMIEAKARLGVGLTIVGNPTGGGSSMTRLRWPASVLQYLGSRGRIAAYHNWLAETVAKHPGRLKAYHYANPFDSDRQLAETQRRVQAGGFVGLMVNTSVRGKYLDAASAEPFFAMAAELDLPVFLHPPADPAAGERLHDPRLLEQVGRYCDVTASLATLVFSGRLARYPGLRIIAPFSGGAISLLQGRLDAAWQLGSFANVSARPTRGRANGTGANPASVAIADGPLTQKPGTYLRHIYVDTVSYSVPTLLANLQMMGPGHLLFGTDSPPSPVPLQESIDMINQLPLSDEDRQKIFSSNARRLFKLGDDVNGI
jgi:aminocarboxymuconate-semialdehyde decarboxylase